VEDEKSVREVTLRALTMHGYSAIPALDGADALRLFEEHDGDFDLLLTDLVMPGIGGRELATRLLTRTPHLRVLFVSGYDRHVADEKGKRGDIGAFLQKPYRITTLLARIREVLDD
jgi:CheY-like chemotaxis protein